MTEANDCRIAKFFYKVTFPLLYTIAGNEQNSFGMRLPLSVCKNRHRQFPLNKNEWSIFIQQTSIFFHRIETAWNKSRDHISEKYFGFEHFQASTYLSISQEHFYCHSLLYSRLSTRGCVVWSSIFSLLESMRSLHEELFRSFDSRLHLCPFSFSKV